MTEENKNAFDAAFSKYFDNGRFDIDRAIERLNLINKSLNNPSIKLYDAIDLYQEGTKLAAKCEEELQGIEKQLNIIKPEG